jgi:hypothetical protein
MNDISKLYKTSALPGHKTPEMARTTSTTISTNETSEADLMQQAGLFVQSTTSPSDQETERHMT